VIAATAMISTIDRCFRVTKTSQKGGWAPRRNEVDYHM
jgi:hypothetical protein